MAKRILDSELSRRERQIMDVIYRLGRASAIEVRSNLPEPPSYSAVRALLRILEGKGHLEHEEEGPRYIYRPTAPLAQAKQSAARRLLDTFFAGSVSQAVATLLDVSDTELNETERAEITQMIQQARNEGR